MPSRSFPVAMALSPSSPGSPAMAAVPAGFQDTLVQGSLAGPTALAFTPDGRLLITPQAGVLRIYSGGALLPDPGHHLGQRLLVVGARAPGGRGRPRVREQQLHLLLLHGEQGGHLREPRLAVRAAGHAT